MYTGQRTTAELLKVLKEKKNYQEYLQEEPDFIKIDFPKYLDRVMQDKGVKKADIIRKSQLDRTYAYQIFSGTRKPGRDKILALGLAMRLSAEEIQKMLKVAECPVLYVKNKRDSIILFGFDKQISLGEMNELLYEMHEDIIE